MKRRAILLLPGTINPTFNSALIAPSDYIIAVDGGIVQSALLSVTPDIWIGDFDSSSDEEKKRYQHIVKKIYPTEKDELDSELALNHVVEMGFDEVLLIGGIGGRWDHQMALTLMPLQFRHLQFFYSDGYLFLMTIANRVEYTLQTQPQKTISLIPLENLEGFSIMGTKWGLSEQSLKVGYGQSLSNETTNEAVRVKCNHGSSWIYYEGSLNLGEIRRKHVANLS